MSPKNHICRCAPFPPLLCRLPHLLVLPTTLLTGRFMHPLMLRLSKLQRQYGTQGLSEQVATDLMRAVRTGTLETGEGEVGEEEFRQNRDVTTG